MSFSKKKAIEEKIEQLKKIKEGALTTKELADLITERRVRWLEENKDVLKKYEPWPDEEKAFLIICFEHMKINPPDIKWKRIGEKKIRLESRNFCPYLEACKILKIDTRYVCKEIVEPGIQKVCEMINPKLKFSRNYENLRPYTDFCEEFFELE